jgi:GNAT superfamily N-acetyltransferase
MSLAVRLVGAGDEAALLALFARAGVSCHCRYWHFEGTKNDWLERSAFRPEESAAELACAVREERSNDGRGVVVLEGSEVVAWGKLFPKAAAKKLLKQGPYNAYSQTHTPDTWCLGCVLVDPARRRQGVARALVGGLAEAGRALGAKAIEAYPRVGHGPVSDEELWMGIAAHLEASAFVTVSGEAPYPVYRLEL